MSRIYLTSFTESESVIKGFYPFSVEIADNDWVFVGGIDIGEQNSLAIRAYEDGELQWTKSFENSTYWGRVADLHFHIDQDNIPYLYAAGSIGVNFSANDFAGIDEPIAPSGKPALPNPIPNGYQGHYQEQLRTHPIFIKLDAYSGQIAEASISASRVVGFDGWNSITVDDLDNVYVAGGGWEPGLNPADPYNGALFDWRTLSISPAGTLNWQFEGEGPVKIGKDNLAYTPFWQAYMLGISSTTEGIFSPYHGNGFSSFPTDSKLIDTKFEYIQYVRSQDIADWLWDSEGNLYILTNRQYDNIQDLVSGSVTQGVTILKITSDGTLEWFKQLNIDGLGEFDSEEKPVNKTPEGAHYAASMVMTPTGELLVGGTTHTNLNGEPAIGKANGDGFFCKVSTSGTVLDTWIFGTKNGYESIQQLKTDSQGNVLVAGFFSAQEYSLEGTDYTELVLISEKGFTLKGNHLDNLIQGGDGDDTVFAGLGDDLIIGGDGKGDDKYYGGAGADTVKYTSATWGITVDLTKGTATSSVKTVNNKKIVDAASIGTDKLYEIENVTAGDFNDVLSGNQLANEIKGEDGDDRIDGRSGNDVLYGDAGNDSLTGGPGNDTLNGEDGSDTADFSDKKSAVIASLVTGSMNTGTETDTLIEIENLVGGKSSDRLTGDGSDNILAGGAGNDILEAGWDEPTLRGGDDTLRGGAGNDTYKIRKSTALYDDIVIDELADKGAGTDTLEIYEDLDAVGAPSEDDVTQAITLNNDGSLTNVFLVNGSQTGSFTIKGRVEFIRDHGIRDGDEFDILIQLWYGSTSIIPSESVVMTLGIGTTAEDKMNGTAKNDHIYGFAGADTLDGKGGGDKLFGGVGNDVYVWSDKYAGDTTISEESGNADQINLTTSGYINFETDDNGNVLINNFSSINGSLLGTLAYKAGTIERMNLILNGKSTIYNSEFLGVFDDPSTLDLSSGITNYIVVAKSDYEFKLGSGADFIIGDAIENVTVDAGAGNDFVNLSLAEDTTGSVLINGGIGADIMMGKAIFNSQRVTFIVDDTKDVVIARADGGSYVIRSSTSYSLNDITGSASLVAATGYVSSLELFGSASINGNGNKLNNTLTGSTGANKIDGKEGNDTLLGGAGNDTLIGGLGNDTLTGGAGNDRFVFDITLNATISNTDTITDFGVDTDKIVLSKSIFKFANGMVNKDGTLNSSDSLSDYLSITGSGSTWSVAYDADGIGTKFQAVSFIDVTLTGLSNSLTATDFLVQ